MNFVVFSIGNKYSIEFVCSNVIRYEGVFVRVICVFLKFSKIYDWNVFFWFVWDIEIWFFVYCDVLWVCE